MKTQLGFSSLELIMAMTISAIIMTSLLEIYNQVSRNMLRVERFVFEDTQLLALKNRFGKDLAGLSAIWFTQADLEAKRLAVDGYKNPLPTADKKKTSQYFYSVNKDKHLDLLTFVTTNALQSYGFVQSRFVRVVYQVEADPAHAGMFRLMRKEIILPTENIDEQSLKPGKFYELVGGIKTLEMTYQLVDKIELEKSAKSAGEAGAKSQEKGEKKPFIRAVKQWVSDNKKPSEKNDKNKKDMPQDESGEDEEDLGGATVPKFVEMKIVFGATDKQLEKEYKLEFYIPTMIDNLPQAISRPVVPVPADVKKGA